MFGQLVCITVASVAAIAASSLLLGIGYITADHYSTSNNAVQDSKILHFIWSGSPFPPFLLCAFDFAIRASPGVSIKLHYPLPEGHDKSLRDDIRATLEWQLAPIREALHNLSSTPQPSDMELVLRDDLDDLVIGCNLGHTGLSQRHFGGIYDGNISKWAEIISGPSTGFLNETLTGRQSIKDTTTHASDILRLIIVWTFGGLYVDSDVWLMDDVPALSLAYGTMLIVENQDVPGSVQEHVNNAFIGLPQYHPFLTDALAEVAEELEEHGLGSVLPAVPGSPSKKAFTWTGVGPALITRVAQRWGARNMTRRTEGYRIHASYSRWTTTFLSVPTAEPEANVRDTSFDTPINLFGRTQLATTHWAASFLFIDVNEYRAKDIAKASAVHLWGTRSIEGRPIRGTKNDLLYHLKNTPMAGISYIHRVGCLAFCDVDLLIERTLPPPRPEDLA